MEEDPGLTWFDFIEIIYRKKINFIGFIILF